MACNTLFFSQDRVIYRMFRPSTLSFSQIFYFIFFVIVESGKKNFERGGPLHLESVKILCRRRIEDFFLGFFFFCSRVYRCMDIL